MSSSIPKIEEIVLEKGKGLGFNIRGGVDNIHIGSDPGIFVTTVKPNGAAAKDGRLQPGDKILEINGNDLRETEHSKAVNCFHTSGERVTLLVERGAEQRILDQLKQSEPIATSTVTAKSAPASSTAVQGRQGVAVTLLSFFKRWWPPLLITCVGGGSVILVAMYFLRKRRLR